MQVWLNPADTCAGVACSFSDRAFVALHASWLATDLMPYTFDRRHAWLHLQHPPGLGDLAVISLEALLLRDHPPVRRHDLRTAHEGRRVALAVLSCSGAPAVSRTLRHSTVSSAAASRDCRCAAQTRTSGTTVGTQQSFSLPRPSCPPVDEAES